MFEPSLGRPQFRHTPAPWFYQEGADAYTHIVRTGQYYFLCQLAQDTSGEAEANARLIAAAPDLLAALTALLESSVYADGEGSISVENGGCDDVQHRAIVEQAKAAIAKAKGESVQ